MAGTKQGRGRKARKVKGEKVPFPPSLIPSPFSFLPLPFLSLRRRLEVVALYERRTAIVNGQFLIDKGKVIEQGSPRQRGNRVIPE